MNIFVKILDDGSVCISQKSSRNNFISTIYLSLMQAEELLKYLNNGVIEEARKQSEIFKESF